MNERQQLLSELRELAVPAVSSLPAIGWWLLVLLIMVLIVAYKRFRRRARYPAWHQEAQKEIRSMHAAIVDGDTDDIVSQCSSLARRLSLIVDNDSTNATVIGKEWLKRLDTIAETPLFSEGVGQLLESAPYETPSDLPVGQLTSLVESIDALCTAVQRRQWAR